MSIKLEQRIKRLEKLVSRKNESDLLEVENLADGARAILDENGFDLYGSRQDGTWAEEFYINSESWTTVFLSVDNKTNDSVYVKILSPQNNNSVNLKIRHAGNLKRLEDELF